MPSSLPSCIVDTNVIIDLWRGGLLEEFFRLPHKLLSPDVVIAELKRPDGQKLLSLGLKSVSLDGTQVEEVIALRTEYKALSTPDLFAFVASRAFKATLLTGDSGLRRLAKENNIPVHGTLWILDEMIYHEVITTAQAARSLERMLEAGRRLPQKPCRERLRHWRR